MADQGFRVGPVLREDGNADRDAQEDLVTRDFKRQTNGVDQLVGNPGRVCRLVDLGQEDGKFIATQTGNQARFAIAASGKVAAACHFRQAPRDHFEHAVAFAYAQAVIDALEPVEIKKEYSTGFAIFQRLARNPFGFLAEALTIGELGDEVDIGEAVDAFEIAVEARKHAVEGIGEHFQLIACMDVDAHVEGFRRGQPCGIGQCLHRFQRPADNQGRQRQENPQSKQGNEGLAP